MAPDAADESAKTARAETLVVLGLAVAAAVAIKVPALFGLHLGGGAERFYFRNASLFVLPLPTVYFVWKRGSAAASRLWLALPFAAGAVFANVFPFHTGSHTEVLTALHLPIALWLAVGFAYVRGRWFADAGRMDFVRFSGELAIYYVLIALGGGVVTAFTFMMFSAIDMNPERFVAGWLIPCRAAGAVIIGSWLVEAKQSVIENMAPVLTRLFTPLFTVLLLVFLGTMVWTGSPINVKREVLIGFDLLLALVVGLVLYAASARDPQAPPDFFDGLQLLLVRQRARGRWGGARSDRSPHLRVRHHSQPSGGSIHQPDSAQRTLSVYRGSGPRLGSPPLPHSFDGWLLEQAVERGASILHGRVKAIMHGPKPPVVTARAELAADLVIVATGVNSRPPLHREWGYRPPHRDHGSR